MRRTIRTSLATAVLAALVAASGGARLDAQGQGSRDTAAALEPLAPGGAAPDESSGGRRSLEAQLRQRIAQVVRARLQLDDRQLAQLERVNQRFEPRRRDLVQRERATRQSLRAELLRGQQADQGHVSSLLDQLTGIQQERLDLFRQEQRELSAFLTPVQRARYAALQEQLRKRVNALRQRQLERRQLRRGVRQGAATPP